MGARVEPLSEADGDGLDFVAIDLETTGTDPSVDQIIQYGAVRVTGGQVTERFSATVRPSRPVPLQVTRLTGLTRAELESGLAPDEALRAFLGFVGRSPVVGHNIRFDLSFLEAEAARGGQVPANGPAFDSLTLARLVRPGMTNFRLATLLAEAGLAPQEHRAGTDAEAAAELFLDLLGGLSSLDPELIRLVARLLDRVQDPVAGLWRQAAAGFRWPGRASRPVPGAGRGLDWPGAGQSGRIRQAEATENDGPPTVLDPAVVAAYLEPGGPMADRLEGYGRRTGQVELTRKVTEAFNDGRILMAEAGTGVGKSLAYLLPAALWAMANGGPVVVSTHTVNLQEQLAGKDLPALAAALPSPLTWCVVKGRAHYLCRRKWEEAREDGASSDGAAFFLARVAVWLALTETGDRGELPLTPPEEEQWAALRADSETCAGAHCPHHGRDCFVSQARMRVEAAHIAVVNHSLLLADVKLGRTILPRYDELIIDEAHNLEDVATENLGLAVDEGEIYRRTGALTRSGAGGPPGLLATVRARLRAPAMPTGEAEHPLELTDKAATGLRSAQRAARELFTLVGGSGGDGDQEEEGRRVKRFRPEQPGFSPVATAAENLALHLKAGAGSLRALSEGLVALGARGWFKAHPLADELVSAALWCTEVGDRLNFFAHGEGHDYVYWAEVEGRPGSSLGRLKAAPVEVGQLVREGLIDRCRAVVLTSATLSVAGDFGHLSNRIGLTAGDERLETLTVESPFDYRRQALLCLPRDLPAVHDRSEEEVAPAVAQFLVDLAEVVGGRTLVLFTSHRLLREVDRLVRPPLERMDICPYAQGIDGSRARLVEGFRSDPRAILMGTAGLWEGIDIPGSALSCVVIVRLPFWPPSIPVLEARAELIRGRGGSPFQQLFLPLAVLRFRQGFGRLIRTQSDRGAVVVLDGRVGEGGATYGSTFVRALPGPRMLVNDSGEVLAGIGDWLAGREPRVISRERTTRPAATRGGQGRSDREA
ncbi:MAG: helicase C-terminal domain-containing protein [Bacillota bacterium]